MNDYAPPPRPLIGVGAMVWKDGRFLLIRRGHAPRQGSWTLPGGRQELGESVEQAAVREILEETGVAIRVTDLLAVVDLIDGADAEPRFHYTVIDVEAEWLSGEAVAGDDADAVAWADPRHLDDYRLSRAMQRVVALGVEKRRNPRRSGALLSLDALAET
ncbi:NUDIX hydrolase [Telmatospirillum siberiense]|uniref:Phosphohydrolase n=1 Tax=Telmatospirillum siberiense TaxID=382514 RepID=A0A2N3PS80_9PROT|nr:NUDIX domain-containing protein [Telmatospirillum siberiense]PKU23252.1 phosphohydrolase [Telmatospirillum siberiense]